jgi:GNAT superfamily N-acetyltransferase
MSQINIATSDDEINACYVVMTELRPHLTLNEFIAQVKRQANGSNFCLVYLFDDEVKAVAGIRIAEWLAGGKYLEIEDLVSSSADRSKGYGGELFDWIVAYAKQQGCGQVRLVSHVKRFDAHRFYFKKRMAIEAHYFSMSV